MANPTPTVLTDAYIAINGTAISQWANHVEITDEASQEETTGFSSSGYRSYIPGLKTASAACTLFTDFANGPGTVPMDQVLNGLYSSKGTFGLEIRPTSAAVSSTNPKYTMTATMYVYSPLNGDVGSVSTIQTTFQNAGTAGMVRGTT